MKVVKTDRRTSLNTDTFSADRAIQLWWSDRTRRPNQKPRKEYRKRDTDTNTVTEMSDFSLENWDDWFSDEDSNFKSFLYNYSSHT